MAVLKEDRPELAEQPTPWRFTAEDYHRMAEAGILHEDDRVELIDGEIVEMTPIGSAHAACVDRVNALLVGLSGAAFVIRVQNPLALGEHLELQPDFSVVRGGDYRSAHPGPGETMLVIEVADTSLAYDRAIKLPLYASAGIPETWIVDLAGDQVERHDQPASGGYRRTERARRGETLGSVAVRDLSLDAEAVLG